MIGVDEAGRGAWAGPLVAAAVLLTKPIAGLKDSKLLSRNERSELAKQIQADCKVGIGWVSAAEIDKLGLTAATSKAMTEALSQINASEVEIVVDGHINYLPDVPLSRNLIKADSLIPAVSAASIIAKVARDRHMSEIAIQFPQYGFDKHVGYGTKLHMEMLRRNGVCELHRKSYKPIREIL